MPRKKLHPVTKYAKDITSGKILANKWVRLACQRHLDDLKFGGKRGLYFDEDKANHIIEFFEEFLVFYEGIFDGLPFLLEPWQQFLLGSLFGWMGEDGYRRFRTAYLEIAKGAGKALALSTPIFTPTGWTTMKMLEVGDKVFDETGSVCNVIGATKVLKNHNCFVVKFSDGAEIIADANHLWKTWTLNLRKSYDYIKEDNSNFPLNWATWESSSSNKKRYSSQDLLKIKQLKQAGYNCVYIANIFQKTPSAIQQQWNRLDRKQKTAKTKTISTKDIKNTLKLRGQWNHVIPLTKAIKYKKKKLPIDPWVLGYLLGDGDSNGSGRVACTACDRNFLIKEFNKRNYSSTKLNSSNIHFYVSKLRKTWQKNNLFKNKHIPQVYFISEIEQRIELMCGLIDSDGYVDGHGAYRFSNTNKLLIDGFRQLANSLGFMAYIYDRGIRERATLRSWEVVVLSCVPLALLKRKRDKARHIWKKEQESRKIVSVEKIDSVPVKCISVDSSNQMYLAGKQLIPTHNSPMAAGVGLYGLGFDGENGAEIYSAATTREQAGILFRDAKAFVDGSEDLASMFIADKGNISYPATNSFFRPVSSEHRGLDGKRPHIALIDEIHEHPNGIVVDKIRAGTKGRVAGMIFEITNSGVDKHSICWQHHEYTEKILEGILENDAWFGYITGLDICDKCAAEGKTIPQDDCPDCDDWRDPKIWPKSNPNLGVSIQEKYVQEQVTEAIGMPSKENIVKRLNFNIWCESITKWLPTDKWTACNYPLDMNALKNRFCYGGLDLSTTTDLTAWVLVFPPYLPEIEEEDQEFIDMVKKNGVFVQNVGTKYQVLCRFFLPEDNMAERVRRDKVPYDIWAKQGYITLTPGNIIDYDFVLHQIAQDKAEYQIKELVFDRWGSQKITTDLQKVGFEVDGKKNLIQFGQGFASMSPPTKECGKMVLNNEIAHGGNPVLSWNVSNVAIKSDPAGNEKPDKSRSVERIDGAVAMIMAIGRAMMNRGVGRSIYEDGGVKSF